MYQEKLFKRADIILLVISIFMILIYFATNVRFAGTLISTDRTFNLIFFYLIVTLSVYSGFVFIIMKIVTQLAVKKLKRILHPNRLKVDFSIIGYSIAVSILIYIITTGFLVASFLITIIIAPYIFN